MATAKKEKSTAKTFIVDAVDDLDSAINHTENDGVVLFARKQETKEMMSSHSLQAPVSWRFPQGNRIMIDD